MATKQTMILIQMGSDERIPRAAMGYIDDLHRAITATVQSDRLAMLARYVPDLCEQFLAEGREVR